MRSDLELNNLAIQLRKKWGEDEYSSVDIPKLASLQDNITLITIEMPSEMSGMCVKSDNEIIIAVNSTMSLGRQRFTIAHELYHAYYDESLMTYVCMQSLGGKKSESEREADKFASFFLAPYSALDIYKNKVHSENWDIETIVSAEQFFGISHQALLFRLFTENRISRADFEKFKEMKITSIAEKLGLGLELYRRTKPYSCTGSYLRKIRKAYDKGLIGEGKRDELLNDGFADTEVDIGDIIDD